MPPIVIILLALTSTVFLLPSPPGKIGASNATQTEKETAAQTSLGTYIDPAVPLRQSRTHNPQAIIHDPELDTDISFPTTHHEVFPSEELLSHSTLPDKEESSPVNDLICLITLPVSNFVAMLAGLPSSLCSALSTDVDQL